MTNKQQNNGTAIALGCFDGLHLGHQKVLLEALSYKKEGLMPLVILFDSHPRESITGERVKKLLTSKEQDSILHSMGFKIVKVDFSKIKALSPESFFNEILLEQLNAKALCCGFNYSFGKNASGNSDSLKAFCNEKGLVCHVAPCAEVSGEAISSTAIRSYLASGNPEMAAKMLGRNYSLNSEVIHGDSRGRTLGFPTANQLISAELTVPKYGVYETLVTVDEKVYKGVTNIGIRPTYRSDVVLAETNILNFSQDIYGKKIKIELIHFLRGERLFDSPQLLVEQLKADVAQVSGNV